MTRHGLTSVQRKTISKEARETVLEMFGDGLGWEDAASLLIDSAEILEFANDSELRAFTHQFWRSTLNRKAAA